MLQGDDEKIQFEDDAHFEREYIEDIQQLLDLIEESGNTYRSYGSSAECIYYQDQDGRRE